MRIKSKILLVIYNTLILELIFDKKNMQGVRTLFWPFPYLYIYIYAVNSAKSAYFRTEEFVDYRFLPIIDHLLFTNLFFKT